MSGNIFIKYNPYTIETIVRFDSDNENNGELPNERNPLNFEALKGKRLQEWIDRLPKMLDDLGTERTYSITFHGTTLDYEDIQALEKIHPIVEKTAHNPGADPENKLEELMCIFEDAQKLGISEISDFGAKITEMFSKSFSAHVVASVSTGKSTLINSMLRQKLIPSSPMVTTALITHIRNDDSADGFTAYLFEKDKDDYSEQIKKITYERLQEINSMKDEKGKRHENELPPLYPVIELIGNIPFAETRGMPLVIVDTPGTSSPVNILHKESTERAIEKDEDTLVVFLINSTTGGTRDEEALLHRIGKIMQEKGKMSRDRFIFIVNKLDEYDEEPEGVSRKLHEVSEYLSERHNIKDARIYPAAAEVALGARTEWANAKKKASAEMMVSQSGLHLEVEREGINSHISNAARQELRAQLEKAVETGDFMGQALIHSGIPVIECAIKEYIEKYAKAIRVGAVAKELRERMNCGKRIATAENLLMANKGEHEKIIRKIDELKEVIAKGKHGKELKENLEPKIKAQLENVISAIDNLQDETAQKNSAFLRTQTKGELSVEEAKNLTNSWNKHHKNTEGEIRKKLEALLSNEIREYSKTFLSDYRKHVELLLTASEIGDFPFDISDLLGADFDVDITTEDFINERETSKRVQRGTKKVKNPERYGFFGLFKIFKPWKIEIPNWETEYGTESYVNATEFNEATSIQVVQNITNAYTSAKHSADKNAADILKEFEHKLILLDKKLTEKAEEKSDLLKNQEELEKRVKDNEANLKELNQLQKRVDAVLEI